MPATMVHASLELMRSDGDYGREKAEASITYQLEDGQDAVEVLAVLQGQLRLRVERDLAESTNLKVRRGVIRQTRRCSRCELELSDEETGYMHPACHVAEEAERMERYRLKAEEDERRWKAAEESAELELAAGKRDAYRDPDDDEEDLPL